MADPEAAKDDPFEDLVVNRVGRTDGRYLLYRSRRRRAGRDCGRPAGRIGGCTVNLVERAARAAVGETIVREYTARCGRNARVFEVEPAAAAGRIEEE